MNRLEHLLTIVAEEGAEVSQRATKAARFGIFEVQPGQTQSNFHRLRLEVADLFAALELVAVEIGYNWDALHPSGSMILAKKEKVEEFLKYSKSVGTLDIIQRKGKGKCECQDGE